MISAIVTMNAGVLVALLFGPNSGRPNAVVTGVGVAIVIAGIVLAIKYAIDVRRRRDASMSGERS